MKKILILNGSSSEIMLIKAAKKLGFYVYTTGNNPELIGHKYADQYCPADFSDHGQILELAKSLQIDAICGNANDLGMLTSIWVAEKLGLPGERDKYAVSRIFHEKDLFKSFAAENGILTPQSVPFSLEKDALEYIQTCEYPVIVKPVDLSAGRGVNIAKDIKEAENAILTAFKKSKAKRIVIEEYLPGRQYDFHTFIYRQKVQYYSASNEYSYVNPYQVSCLTIPADHGDDISQMLVNDIEKMAKVLQIADGPFWVQYRIKDDRPYIIETARRCGGNNMLDIVSRGFGVDCAEWVVRMESGMDYHNFPRDLVHKKAQGYQSLMAPYNGKIKGVYVSEELRKHLYGEYYWYDGDTEVTDYMYERFGILLFEYDTPEEMFEMAKKINKEAYLIVEQHVGNC